MISATILVCLLLSIHAETSKIQTKHPYTASNIQAHIEPKTANKRDYYLNFDASMFKRQKWISRSDKSKWLTETDIEFSRRVKRDDNDVVIWDNCPGKLHYAVIDGELKCVAGDAATGLADRVVESLENCPKGTRKVVLPGGIMLCLERKRRRKT